MNKICEMCAINHGGEYGSGRFCSAKCARGFSTKAKRKYISKRVSERLTGRAHPHKKGVVRNPRECAKKISIGIKRWHREKLLSIDFDLLKGRSRKTRILIEQDYRCAICNIRDRWNGQPLTLHLDHIDGNRKNNSRGNLRCICPNCHTQTPNHGSKNAKAENRDRMLSKLRNNTLKAVTNSSVIRTPLS